MMEKLKNNLIILVLCIGLLGCQSNNYTKTYTLQYFYLEGCPNCEYFTKNGLPLIKEEFGNHMQVIKYDMDDSKTLDEVQEAYDLVIDNLIDFDQDDYGKGPFLVLEDYYCQLGVVDINKYLKNLIAVITDQKLEQSRDFEKYYYFKDEKVKEE